MASTGTGCHWKMSLPHSRAAALDPVLVRHRQSLDFAGGTRYAQPMGMREAMPFLPPSRFIRSAGGMLAAVVTGWLAFYEGTTIEAELTRFESTGWRP